MQKEANEQAVDLTGVENKEMETRTLVNSNNEEPKQDSNALADSTLVKKQTRLKSKEISMSFNMIS